jgi:hypothetical protein
MISSRPVTLRICTSTIVGIMTFSRVQDVKIPDKNPLRTLRVILFAAPGPEPRVAGSDGINLDLSYIPFAFLLNLEETRSVNSKRALRPFSGLTLLQLLSPGSGPQGVLT